MGVFSTHVSPFFFPNFQPYSMEICTFNYFPQHNQTTRSHNFMQFLFSPIRIVLPWIVVSTRQEHIVYTQQTINCPLPHETTSTLCLLLQLYEIKVIFGN